MAKETNNAAVVEIVADAEEHQPTDSESEPKDDSTAESKRNRGAQPGNLNAFGNGSMMVRREQDGYPTNPEHRNLSSR